jgi:protein O-GlcNAc transferase
VAAHQTGRVAEAEALYRRMLRADAGNFPALHMLGFLKAQQGAFDEAAKLLSRALKARPGDPATLSHHAHALLAAGRRDEAMAAYDALLSIDPNAVDALYNKGVILSDRGEPVAALALFDRALALNPQAPGTLYNRGVVLAELGRHEEAMANYERALALQPNLVPAAANRAYAALNLCDWRRVAEIAPDMARIAVPPLTVLGYSDDKALQLEQARAVIRAEIPEMPAPFWRGERYNHDRIRLAYVSADLNEHAVGVQIAPLIEAHDRSRFEAIAISIGGETASPTRERLRKGFDQFHHLAGLNSEEIARRMRAMEIDIAIDLGGHTNGARPRLFAHRPAPVQAAWLGYPGTTGAPFIDYLIADAIVAPFADQPFYTERLVHLPDSYFPTDPAISAGPAPRRADLGLPENGFVFCCFNNGWKLTRPLFDVWMRLLHQAPGSVLWLRMSNDPAHRNLRREAASRGIDPARLVFGGFAPIDEYLARLAQADLFLDTLPYNAHATAVHALWAGLPVLTLEGHAFAARVGASLLGAVGLQELITHTLADYEAVALRLAQEPGLLASFKKRLVSARHTAPLFDLDRFRRNMETAYAGMMARIAAPESFSVR